MLISGKFDAGNIVFDHDGDYLIENGGTYVDYIKAATSFIKRGSGTLTMQALNGNKIDCDLVIEAGDYVVPNPNNFYSMGNYKASRQVIVQNGASLVIKERNAMGGATDPQLVEMVVQTNGLLSLEKGCQTIHTLTLDGGTLDYGAGYNSTWGVLFVKNRFSFDGPAPYTLAPSEQNYCFFQFGREPALTEIRVADITNDADADVSITLPIKNDGSGSGSGFIKTGPGTLALGSTDSTFDGDLEIREGVVACLNPDFQDRTSSILGNMKVDRQILVSTNATLHLLERNSLGVGLVTNTHVAEIHVDHGTLKLGTPETIKGINTIGALTLDDGTLDYTEMYHNPYGFLKICRYWRLLGTTPYVFEKTHANGCLMLLNPDPLFRFEVADITGDAEADATFHFPFKQWTGTEPGFVKDGAGTMRLTAANSYSGTTFVSNGTLRVDGSIAASDRVQVLENAFLSGTGTVSSVTIESDGGLKAVAAGTDTLQITGSLTIEGEGTVHLHNPGGLSESAVDTVIADVSGSIAGDQHLENWTVEIEGLAQTSSYRVKRIGSTLVASYAPSGTLILLQ
ncbi:MAG: autotransporter-associated beta strand repeat-containing protein [Kiritimatiellia bacterium]